jgi:hypothetical protein
MHWLLLTTCLLAQDAAGAPLAASDAVRSEYRADAEKYEFHSGGAERAPLKLLEQPIMRWFNDNDWSGDVFVWTDEAGDAHGRPSVVGCILSGPRGVSERRMVFHEFHVLADAPIAPAALRGGSSWKPAKGLKLARISGAPEPADSAAGRLVQMRRLARDFTAHMQADGPWELRLLTQPLHRYGQGERDAAAEVVDGALFAYVWTRGTDPELLLLLECRRDDKGVAWHYAPVRFSNKELWLKRDAAEIWRAESYAKLANEAATLPYTTSYARDFTVSTSSPAEEPQP